MTHVVVSNITPRTSYSPTTGTSYTIPSTWGFFASSDIVAYSGTTQLSYNSSPSSSTQFSVTGTAVDGGYQGGSITLGAASTANTITLILEVPVARETDFPYPAATINIEDLNTDLDKSYVIHQQFVRDLARVPAMADSDTGSIGTLPQSSDRAGKFLYFDTTGGVTAAGLTLSGTTVSVSAFMLTTLDDADAATFRTTVGAAASTSAISDPTTTAGDMLYRDSTGVTRRALGSAGTVLASTNSVPAWKTVTGLLDELFSSTQGAVLYRGSSEWASLAAGTSGQYLKTNGSGGNPAWTTLSGFGKVLQYKSAAVTTQATYTSTSFVTTGIGVTFTSLATTSSKVLVTGHIPVVLGGSTGFPEVQIRLYRQTAGGGYSGISEATVIFSSQSAAVGLGDCIPFSYIDSPASTQQVDYLFYVARTGTTESVLLPYVGGLGNGNVSATMDALELGV